MSHIVQPHCAGHIKDDEFSRVIIIIIIIIIIINTLQHNTESKDTSGRTKRESCVEGLTPTSGVALMSK